MDFHFLVMEKSWKINVEKEGAPWCVQFYHSSDCLQVDSLSLVYVDMQVLAWSTQHTAQSVSPVCMCVCVRVCVCVHVCVCVRACVCMLLL